MLSNKKIIIAFTFIIVAFALNFFEAKFALEDQAKYIRVGILGISIALSVPYFFVKRGLITFAIQLICLSIIASIFICEITWDQSYIDTLKVTIPAMMWFFYFFLSHYKVPVNVLEKIVVVYGIIYMLLFTFQFVNSNTVYFGYRDEFILDRGIIRIDFPGGGVFFLMLFIALTKYKENTRTKFKWLVLIIAGVVITLIQVTRQNIAAVVIVCVFHFMANQSIYKKAITILVLAGAFLLITNSNLSIVKGLKENELSKNNSIENNIRIEEATYFLQKYSPYDYNQIVGNGIPYTGKTHYGIYEFNLRDKGYYFTDVGLIAFYCYFGVVAIIAYFILFVKSFFIKLPLQYIYLKYYVFYLVVTSFTSASVFSENFLIANVFVFYSLQEVFINMQYIKRIRSTYDNLLDKNLFNLPNLNV